MATRDLEDILCHEQGMVTGFYDARARNQYEITVSDDDVPYLHPFHEPLAVTDISAADSGVPTYMREGPH